MPPRGGPRMPKAWYAKRRLERFKKAQAKARKIARLIRLGKKVKLPRDFYGYNMNKPNYHPPKKYHK